MLLRLFHLLIAACAAAVIVPSQGLGGELPSDLADLSLEQLMDIEVTSVSKQPEKLSNAAAAVYVLTGEEIRRSGARSIPEALRMVPGMNVARLTSNKWAVSPRGFNYRYANKLLVMIDGRSVYTPFFSGVFWEVHNVMIEDLDRIEIIRGPGGTLWGANAFNGVINIITKSARDTQGGVLSAGVGTEEKGFGTFRYGGRLSDDAWYRIYARHFHRDGLVDADGHHTSDDWSVPRGGFRVDWHASDDDTFTFQGDGYSGKAGQRTTSPTPSPPFTTTFDENVDLSGGNFLTNWRHRIDDESNCKLRLYYDTRSYEMRSLAKERGTLDLDFQHTFPLGERHHIVWGLGYRLNSYDLRDSFALSIEDEGTSDIFSGFIQDEIAIVPDKLTFTVGSKLEYNDYTGVEVQPSARLTWTPNNRQTIWAAVSKVVRTPSLAENALAINFPLGGANIVRYQGSSDFRSENLMAYELGYRIELTERLLADIAGFYNKGTDLRTYEQGNAFVETDPPPPHVIVPFLVDNWKQAETYGLEVAVDWQPLDWWRLRAGYTALEMHLTTDGRSSNNDTEEVEGRSPEHQVFLHSSMDLPHNIQFDTTLRYVDNLPAFNIGSYTEMDARLGWKPADTLEVFISGRNLIRSHHPEFAPIINNTQYTEPGRALLVGATWRF